MTSTATPSDAELARDIAQQAGQLLLTLRGEFDGDLSVREDAKRLRDTADAASHHLIVDLLAAARPGDAVLSEEGADDDRRLSAERVWIVDPLDGTWEYGQDREDFAVHVALWERGVLVAGAVDLPAQGIVHTTGTPTARADEVPADRPVRIVVSRTRPPAAIDAIAAAVSDGLGREVEVVTVGSAGAKTAEVLAGRVDAYVHDAGLSEWDVAAPAAVAVAGGLTVCHLSGADIAYNRMPPLVGDLVIGIPSVADRVLAAVAAG
jgi:3'(2'), 5'-bisphosphate nucleotidase